MHVHGGCTDTVRKSPLKVDWEKNCLPYTGLEPLSVLCLAFQSDALPTKLSSPLFHCYRKIVVLFCAPCLSVWKGVIVCLVFTSIIHFCPVLERCCPPPPLYPHTHTTPHTHTHTHTTPHAHAHIHTHTHTHHPVTLPSCLCGVQFLKMGLTRGLMFGEGRGSLTLDFGD